MHHTVYYGGHLRGARCSFAAARFCWAHSGGGLTAPTSDVTAELATMHSSDIPTQEDTSPAISGDVSDSTLKWICSQSKISRFRKILGDILSIQKLYIVVNWKDCCYQLKNHDFRQLKMLLSMSTLSLETLSIEKIMHYCICLCQLKKNELDIVCILSVEIITCPCPCQLYQLK